jgi:hypothetical protein
MGVSHVNAGLNAGTLVSGGGSGADGGKHVAIPYGLALFIDRSCAD